MSIQSTGFRAYSDAVAHFNKVEGSLRQGAPVGKETLFARTLDQSLLRDRVDRPENFGAQADFIKYADQKHIAATPANSFSETIKNSLEQVHELAFSCSQIGDYPSCHQSLHPISDGSRCSVAQPSTGTDSKSPIEEREEGREWGDGNMRD